MSSVSTGVRIRTIDSERLHSTIISDEQGFIQRMKPFNAESSARGLVSTGQSGGQQPFDGADIFTAAGKAINGALGFVQNTVEVAAAETIDFFRDTFTDPFSSYLKIVNAGVSEVIDIFNGGDFPGQILKLQGDATNAVTINNANSVGNTTSNIILPGTDASMTLIAEEMVEFIFDPLKVINGFTGAWRLTSTDEISGGGGGEVLPAGTAVNDHIEWNGGSPWVSQQFLEFDATGPHADTGFLRFPNDIIMLAARNVADDGNVELKVGATDILDLTENNNSSVAFQVRSQHASNPDNILALSVGSGTSAVALIDYTEEILNFGVNGGNRLQLDSTTQNNLNLKTQAGGVTSVASLNITSVHTADPDETLSLSTGAGSAATALIDYTNPILNFGVNGGNRLNLDSTSNNVMNLRTQAGGVTSQALLNITSVHSADPDETLSLTTGTGSTAEALIDYSNPIMNFGVGGANRLSLDSTSNNVMNLETQAGGVTSVAVLNITSVHTANPDNTLSLSIGAGTGGIALIDATEPELHFGAGGATRLEIDTAVNTDLVLHTPSGVTAIANFLIRSSHVSNPDNTWDISVGSGTGATVAQNLTNATSYTWQIAAGTEMFLNATNLDIDAKYMELESITAPGATAGATIGRVFMDSGNSNHLSIRRNSTSVDLEGAGGVSFPIEPPVLDHEATWTSPVNIDLSLTTAHSTKFTLDGDLTVTLSNIPADETQIEFEMEFVQDGTGGWGVTFPSEVVESLTVAQDPGALTIFTFRVNDGTNVHAVTTLAGTISGGSGTSPPFDDNQDIIQDNTDNTKVWRMTLDAINTGQTKTFSFVGGNTSTYTFPSVGGLVAALDIDQNWSGIQSFNDGKLKVRNPAGSFSYLFQGEAITANKTFNLPDTVSATDTFVMEADSQTLTNKTLSTGFLVSADLGWLNGVKQTFNPNATNAGINVGAQADPEPTSAVAGDIVYNSTDAKFKFREGAAWVELGGGSSFADNVFDIHDNVTPTKILQFSLNNLIAGTSLIATNTLSAARTWTLPDGTGTIGLLTLAQAWSNTQTFNDNVVLGSGATDDLAINAEITTDIVPNTDSNNFLGSATGPKFWAGIFTDRVNLLSTTTNIKWTAGTPDRMDFNVIAGDGFEWLIGGTPVASIDAAGDWDFSGNNLTDVGDIRCDTDDVNDIGGVSAGNRRFQSVYTESLVYTESPIRSLLMSTSGMTWFIDTTDTYQWNVGTNAHMILDTDNLTLGTSGGLNLNLIANSNTHGFIDLPELSSHPANPGTDTARLYCINNTGKTELYVRFQTGAGVLIRAEP